MLSKFVLPALMPQRKILSVDIGGTLAKTAFYIPKSDPVHQDIEALEKITSNSLPRKSRFHILISAISRTFQW